MLTYGDFMGFNGMYPLVIYSGELENHHVEWKKSTVDGQFK